MKKISLFLTDDHQIVLDGLQAFLEKDPQIEIAGTAHSGEETLEAMERTPVDVVILDISMPPGMDGIETAKLIKRRFPRTKVILLTMIGEARYILSALRLGINGYIVKEKSKETLMAAINAVMLGNRYIPLDVLNRLEGMEDGPEDNDDEVKLTSREKEILCLMAAEPSLNSQELADRLFIVKVTAEKHIQNMKKKLDLHKNTELVKYAIDKKICTR